MEDRRVKRSKRLLKQGLVELMQEKKFADITVRDITERMDLNRGTFYLHFTDVNDLLQKLENDIFGDVQSLINAHRGDLDSGTLQPLFEPILSYIVENRGICGLLLANNANSNFIERMHRLICANGAVLIAKRFHAVSAEKEEYLFSFVTYGLIGLIEKWFHTGMALDKGELIHMADGLLNTLAEHFFSSPG
jgi:AcrR family transcriptional regulator